MPDEMSPQQAQAALDARLADPNDPYNSGTYDASQQAAEDLLELRRIAGGAEARAVVTTTDTPLRTAPYTPPPAGSPLTAESKAPVVDMDLMVTEADRLGFDRGEMRELVRLEASLNPGEHSEAQLLAGLGPIEVDRFRKYHRRGLARLPLSAIVRLERGTMYAPAIARRFVQPGQEMFELDEAIAEEAQRNPTGQRLRELVLRRDGPRGVILA